MVMKDKEVEDKIIEIRQKLTLYMNGAAAAGMRSHGIVYRLNYGVSIPDLLKIAGEYQKNHILAQELWRQECRECKMLGAMLEPHGSFSPDLADLWMESIRYSDLAEVCSRYLFRYMPGASETAFRWIACDNDIVQYCGFLTIAGLMRSGLEMRDCYLMELKDQACAAMSSDSLLPRQGAAAVLNVYSEVYGEN